VELLYLVGVQMAYRILSIEPNIGAAGADTRGNHEIIAADCDDAICIYMGEATCVPDLWEMWRQRRLPTLDGVEQIVALLNDE
jgi:hypothetical protein